MEIEKLEEIRRKDRVKKGKRRLHNSILNFPLIKFIIKIGSIFYSKMVKVSVSDIYILDAIEDEEYLKNKTLYKNYRTYFDNENFIYTLIPKKIFGYSLSHIGQSFKKIYKKNALLIIAEETRNSYKFKFIYTGEPYNKDNLGDLELQKDDTFFINDKRLEYALIYYLYLIEDKEIYIISDKKLDFFKGYEDYIKYLRKGEVYQILIRTKLLELDNRVYFKFIGIFGLIASITFAGYYFSEQYFLEMKKDYVQNEKKIKYKIIEQSEKTEYLVKNKETLDKFLNDGKGLLK